MMKCLVAVLALAFSFAIAPTARAVPTNQVDIITLGGPTYTGDQWTLHLSGPIAATVIYTVTDADVFGCNICNTTEHWGAAINSDPIMSSFLTATFQVWDGIGPVPPSIITLTANAPGIPFSAFVSVLEDCDCNGNESEPLSASIVTTTEAFTDVPEPSMLVLLSISVLGLGALQNRREFLLCVRLMLNSLRPWKGW